MTLPKRALYFFLLYLIFIPAAFGFSFAVLGDSHGNRVVFDPLVGKLNADKELSFVVHTGDFVTYNSDLGYQNYADSLKALKLKLYQVPGNHDLAGQGYRQFEKVFGRYYYSFDFENARFIVLNNAFAGSFTRRQFEWLKAELQNAGSKKIFVFMHRPLFDPAEIYDGYVMSGTAVTRELMGLFTKYKVARVCAGHIHAYARAERDGVVYLVNGGAGGQLHLADNLGGYHHYVKIRVDGDKVTDQVIRLDE